MYDSIYSCDVSISLELPQIELWIWDNVTFLQKSLEIAIFLYMMVG